MTLKSNLIGAIIQYKIHKRHKIPYVMESPPSLQKEVNVCGLQAGFFVVVVGVFMFWFVFYFF